MKKDEPSTWVQAGIASLIPGMQYMIERMQKELDALKAHLAMLQGPPAEAIADNARVYMETRRGRPPGKTANSGWPADPEERKKEMARRIAVAQGKEPSRRSVNLAPTHPRDPRHPNHERWLANLRKAQKRTWNALTPEQRQVKIARMNKARRAA